MFYEVLLLFGLGLGLSVYVLGFLLAFWGFLVFVFYLGFMGVSVLGLRVWGPVLGGFGFGVLSFSLWILGVEVWGFGVLGFRV